MDSSASLQNTLGQDNSQGEEETVDPRRCSHLREDGSRCKGWKVKGEELCSGHLGLGVAANPREAASRSAEVRKGQAEERTEAEKQAGMSLKARLAAAVEREAETIVDALLDVIKNGSDADKLRAVESLLSRVYGKPKETVETVTTPRTVEALSAMSPEERRQLLIQLEGDGRMPTLRAVGE